jgi:hypothetical protein
MEDIVEEPSIKFPSIREASIAFHEENEKKLTRIESVPIDELNVTNPSYVYI